MLKRDTFIKQWTCSRCGWRTNSQIQQNNHLAYHALSGDIAMPFTRDERAKQMNDAFGHSGWETVTNPNGWTMTHEDGASFDIKESEVEEPFIPYVHMLMVRHRQEQGHRH